MRRGARRYVSVLRRGSVCAARCFHETATFNVRLFCHAFVAAPPASHARSTAQFIRAKDAASVRVDPCARLRLMRPAGKRHRRTYLRVHAACYAFSAHAVRTRCNGTQRMRVATAARRAYSAQCVQRNAIRHSVCLVLPPAVPGVAVQRHDASSRCVICIRECAVRRCASPRTAARAIPERKRIYVTYGASICASACDKICRTMQSMYASV